MSSAPTRKFHIIQPVVVNQKIRSPACASMCRLSFLSCSSRIPPWPWTIAFGRPVVPLEYRTQRGWSNGTATSSSSASGGSEEAVLPAVARQVAEAHERPADLRVDVVDDRRRGRGRARRSGSRRPRAGPSARSARSGRRPSARRSPASSSTRSRRAPRRPGTPRSSPGCSACTRRRGRRGRRRARAGRPGCARSARAARPRSSRQAAAARRRGGSRRRRPRARGRRARDRRASRRRTTARPASRASRAPRAAARRSARRSTSAIDDQNASTSATDQRHSSRSHGHAVRDQPRSDANATAPCTRCACRERCPRSPRSRSHSDGAAVLSSSGPDPRTRR